MAQITAKQIAHIKIWVKGQGMDDETYRDWLWANFRAKSAKDLSLGDYAQFRAQFALVDPPQAVKKIFKSAGITPAQNGRILALWGYRREPGLKALSNWLKGRWEVDDTRKLTKEKASKVITALEKGDWGGGLIEY